MPTTNDAVSSSLPTLPPPPAPRRPRLTGGTILAASLGLIGLALAFVTWGGPSGAVTNGSATIRPSAPVDRIVLAVEAGSIGIVPGDEVRVDATRADQDLVVDSDLTDGTLEVDVACPRFALLRGCLTPVRLIVPPGVEVVASTEAGTITASGLDAGADLHTQAGTIEVRGLAGDSRLRSETGAIRGSVLAGTIEARTTTGAIALHLAADVGDIVATSEVGTIDLTVPDAPYQVDVGAGLGRTEIDIAHSAGAERTLEARSELGRISIRTAASR